MDKKEGILQLFPVDSRSFWLETAKQWESLQEIRLRNGKPVIVISGGREYFLDEKGKRISHQAAAYCVEGETLEKLLQHICHYSLYAFADELRQGFITVPGGHRVGIVGQVVCEENGSVRTIKNISGINIRISHEIRGVADKVLPGLYSGGQLKNVLIVSPPGCGKTTLLRDIIRQVSDGNAYGEGMCVGVVDERSEIAGTYQGMAQNDVGMRTDVLDACPKVQGMMLLLRSMSPQVIAIDELGGTEDILALRTAAYCGSRIVATIHGSDVWDVFVRLQNEAGDALGFFDCFVILGRKQGCPVVKDILEREDVYAAIGGRIYDSGRMSGAGHLVSGTVCTEAAVCTGSAGYIRNVQK